MHPRKGELDEISVDSILCEWEVFVRAMWDDILDKQRLKMNEAQRIVLQRHFRQLASDLILTEDFIGMLYQHRIFERNMIEIIKVH